MSTIEGNGFLRAVRASEHDAVGLGRVEAWKYALLPGTNQPVEEVHVRCGAAATAQSVDGAQWTGIFDCARSRRLEVLSWPAASAVVVVSANAVYLVDPSIPEQFSGFNALAAINDVTFDESAQHMFVSDSLCVYAFSSNRRFQWMSEPLDGYVVRFSGCGGRVLAVELKPYGLELEGEDAAPSVVRLRTEDGTILRSRFRLAHQHWITSAAA